MEFFVAWVPLESNDLDLTGASDGREEADSFWMSQLEGSQDHQSLGLEDFLICDNTCNDTYSEIGKALPRRSCKHGVMILGRQGSMVNLLDEPIAHWRSLLAMP